MRFRLALALLLIFAPVTFIRNDATAQQKPAPPALPLTSAWSTALDASPSAWPAGDGKQLFLALQATDQHPAALVAVSLADGAVRWRRPLDGVRFLAASDDLVFAAKPDAVVAFAAADGQPAWEVPVDSPPAVAPSTAGGWLVLADEKQVLAVRAREGTVVWRHPLDSAPVATPVFAGEGVYLATADSRVLRLAVATGAPVWQATLAAPASTLLALDDRVFVGTRGRFFYALDPRNGHREWRVRIGSDVVGTPIVDRKLVYFLSLDNLIRGVDRGNGSLHARQVLTRRALFGPFALGDLLLVSGMTPTLEAFHAGTLQSAGLYEAGGRELGGVKLAGPIYVVPGKSEEDTLIVSVTGEGEVLALKKPKK
ncbi:MAG: PQQ-binding-like beta-propeller repeat protein [Bacteroidales bacterium]